MDEREMAMLVRAEWHTGRSHGLEEGLRAVEKVRAMFYEQYADAPEAEAMKVTIPLDECATQLRLLIAGASDQARNEGFDRDD